MAITRAEVVSVLNHLIQTCKDGENGFRDAAEAVDRSDLKALFLDLSAQRQRFVSELQTEVVNYGDKAETSGSTMAMLHRGWINIKSIVSSRNEHEIIEECERGEDAAVETYQEALRNDLPADVRPTIMKQFQEIQAAHDKVRALEVATENAQ